MATTLETIKVAWFELAFTPKRDVKIEFDAPQLVVSVLMSSVSSSTEIAGLVFVTYPIIITEREIIKTRIYTCTASLALLS